MARTVSLITIALSALCIACGDEHEGDPHADHSHDTATATLAPKSDITTLAGTATFSGEPGEIEVEIEVTGAPPGEHGVHIHETGDCNTPDAMSAGAHWDPTHTMLHGRPGDAVHLGEIGNMTVGADGKGSIRASHPEWEVGTESVTDVVGKAVIVHAQADDFMTQPSGNSGARIGCGVIQ